MSLPKSNLENKLLVIDTTNIDDEALIELEIALDCHNIEFKERDLDVIQELEVEACICIEKAMKHKQNYYTHHINCFKRNNWNCEKKCNVKRGNNG